MKTIVILFALVGTFTWPFVATQGNPYCRPGDFCSYKCHCSSCGPINGLCAVDATCVKGWFGHSCQYQDLKPDQVEIEAAQQSKPQWLMDNNDTTCNKGASIGSVTMTLNNDYPLTWIRIVLNDTAMFSTVKLFYNETEECQKTIWSRLNERTMDIRCEKSVLMRTLKITGNLDSLCSVYINGGRNVAYTQRASQSSNFSNSIYLANSAVDGNYNTFSHTGSEERPRFSLTFNTNYLVTRFLLYNRAGFLERLRGFRLQSFDTNSIVVDNHKDISEQSQSLYVVIGNASVPISSLSVNDTSRISTPPYVTLMEIETYGECPPGKWSLPCTRNCSDLCPTSCHRDDGECNTVCAGFCNPPECTKECEKENWGINCNNNCSTKCFNLSCDSRSGKCDQGCLGYSDPPLCTKDCLEQNWGINCSRNCSDKCLNNTCTAAEGACYGGCKSGYQLPDCTKVCSDGHWGINCSKTCNTNCYDNICHPVTGSCSLGCIEGYQLPNCTLPCDNVNYGSNCSLNCSIHCITEECNATDGSCSCLEGFEGSTCQQRIEFSDSSRDSVGVIIGSVVAALVVIIIIFSIVIIWRRKRTPNYKNEFQDNGHHNIVVLDNLKDEQYTLTQKKIRISDLNEVDKEQSNPYIEVPDDFAADTMMAVESLNTYMKSKDAEFYKKQFERIPQAGNVTQDIGLSKENKHKNRYKNICPYDHSRVHLEINADQNELDYINASYIRGFNDEVNFIATQGPQKSTISDFIRMLWEQRIDIVVMLTDLVEETKVKCEKYWPDSGKIRIGHIKVNLGSTQVFADYTIRKLELFKKGEASHSFTQFHFTSWPDKGVPSTQWSLVDVEQRVASIPTKRPIVVHCSAGVGRTGTFIALYNIMRQAEETGLVDFFKTVSKLREDRTFMVQTSSQYEFLHKSAQVAIACMKTTVHAHDFSDRLNVLERQHILGSTLLETEFNSLCAVIDRSEQNFPDEFNVYENESKNKIDSDYELEHDTKTNAKNNFLFLPGYKQRDQHILTKIPSTSEEALTLWKFVVDYCISLIVAFEIDIDSQKTFQYLEDKDVVSSSTEVQLKSIKKTKFMIERSLNVQCQKSANFLPSSKGHAEVTHLTCLSFDLEPKTVMELTKRLRQCFSQTGGKVLYICSDGFSQSGFLAVLSLLLDRVDNESCLSIPLIVGTVKSLQPKIIPNIEQYQAIYRAVSRYIDTSSQYSNTNYQKVDQISSIQNTGQANDEQKRKSQVQQVIDITTTETNTDPQKKDTFLYANVM